MIEPYQKTHGRYQSTTYFQWHDLYDLYLFSRKMVWPGRLSGIDFEVETMEIVALGFLT